jgi:hypothetical protein
MDCTAKWGTIGYRAKTVTTGSMEVAGTTISMVALERMRCPAAMETTSSTERADAIY